jgi:hypothetical protein
MATINIVVTVANPGSGNRYYLDGVLQATISAIPGNTYKFDQADGTNSGHPLRLSITSNGTHGGGSAYTDGVTTSGTPGSGGAYTQIVVDATTVQTLYYYCTNHSGMGGSFNVGSSSTVQLQDRKGFDVQNFSADQTSVGQIYYNSASGTFKGVIAGGVSIGTWSSGGSLNTKRMGAGGAGTQTAGAIFGGDNDGVASPRYGLHEQYNGSAWTELADLNQGKSYTGGAGISTSALNFSGYAPQRWALTELWNGSSWTELNDMNTARFGVASVGQVSTAALAAGGSSASTATATIVESWNGSSWTEVGDINSGRAYFAGSGTPSAGLVFGGPSSALTELWNGSSWTEVNDMNSNARYGVGGSRQGTSTAALGFGGNPGNVNTEIWNGSSWTELNNLATARGNITGIGTTSLALAVGGEPPYLTATEEWTQPSSVLNQTIGTS